MFIGSNVGIGTTTPGYKLDVVGDVKISQNGSGGSLKIAPTTNSNESSIGFYTNANLSGTSAGSYWVIGQGSWSSGAGNFGIGTSTTGRVVLVTSNANVGIAYTAPQKRLHVGGVISTQQLGEARYHLYNNGATAEWTFGQKASNNHNFIFTKVVSASESDYLTIDTSGNVGIGLTPTYKCDVSGTLRCGTQTSIPASGGEAAYINGTLAILNGRNDNVRLISALDNSMTNNTYRYIQFGQSNGNGNTGEFVYNYFGNANASNSVGIGFHGLRAITCLYNGNVGIGVTFPTSKFEVSGNARFVGTQHTIYNTSYTSIQFSNDRNASVSLGLAYQAGHFSADSGSNDFIIRNDSTVGKILLQNGGTNAAFIINSNNNVGIATAAPLYKLHVSGDVFASGPTTLSNTLITYNGTTTHSNDLIVSGITTLSNSLNISGATTLSNTLNVSGATVLSNTLLTFGTTTFSNALTMSGVTTLSNSLNISGATTLSNTLNVSGATVLSNTLLTFNGTTTHSNALIVSGITTLSNSLNISGATTLSNTLNVSGVTVLSNTLLTFNGTTTHSNALIVSGITTLSNSLNISGATTLSNTLNVSGAMVLSNTLLTFNNGTFSNNLYVSGNIGVGTSSPSYKVDIIGTLGVSNFIQFPNVDGGKRIVLWDNGAGGYNGIGKDPAATTYAVTATTNFHKFIAYNSGTSNELMRLTGTGSLGIGSSNPSELLHVYNSTNANLLLESTASKTRIMSFNDGKSYYQTSNDLFFGQIGTSTNPRFYITSAGSVGVGTMSPSAKLDVFGTFRVSPSNDNSATSLFMDSSGQTNGKQWLIASTHNTSPDGAGKLLFKQNTNSITAMAINSNGLIGIGTTSPVFTLDVNGTTDSVIYSTCGGFSNSAARPSVGTNVIAGEIHSYGCGPSGTTLQTNVDDGFLRLSAGGNATANTKAYIDLMGSSTLSERDRNIVFGIGDEKVRIDSNGNFGIGTTTPSYKLHVIGDVYVSGNITAFSDVRFKQALEIIHSPLEKINQLNGYTYEFVDNALISQKTKVSKRYTGIVAQEIQDVLPEVVHQDQDGHLSVAYGNMAGLFVESIKELSKQNTLLKLQLEKLEERIWQLESSLLSKC
jgi:hypothetical protein